MEGRRRIATHPWAQTLLFGVRRAPLRVKPNPHVRQVIYFHLWF
jgi:hypothetical protein